MGSTTSLPLGTPSLHEEARPQTSLKPLTFEFRALSELFGTHAFDQDLQIICIRSEVLKEIHVPNIDFFCKTSILMKTRIRFLIVEKRNFCF